MAENNKDKNTGKNRFEITELFMAKAGKKGYDRSFYGTIHREKDNDGKEIAVSGRVTVNDGMIWSRAGNKDELGDRLDTLVLMILDHGLHEIDRHESVIASGAFNHN